MKKVVKVKGTLITNINDINFDRLKLYCIQEKKDKFLEGNLIALMPIINVITLVKTKKLYTAKYKYVEVEKKPKVEKEDKKETNSTNTIGNAKKTLKDIYGK